MDLIKGLKSETIEKLADLWINPDFKELIKVLRLTQDKYGKLCLTRNTNASNWLEVRELQDKAAGISLVIKTVEQAFNKLNKGEK